MNPMHGGTTEFCVGELNTKLIMNDMAKNSGGTIRLRTSELILSLISANDGLEGKTTIQKLVYFAEQLESG